MGYSGLIYAAIVAAWLAVLVPRWVRRNEEVERARETDAANGVRVLQPRSGPIHAPHRLGADVGATIISADASGLAPVAAASPQERWSTDDAVGARSRGGDQTRHSANRSARIEAEVRRMNRAFADAARRRRSILSVLLLSTISVTAGALLGPLPSYAAIASGLALVGFLVVARRAAVHQARRQADLRRRLERQRAADARAVLDEHAPAVTDDGKRVAVLDAPGVAEPPAKDTWEPVNVPLPTYVTAPKAPRRIVRKIELNQDGSWTSGRLDPDKSFDLPTHRPEAPSAPAADAQTASAAETSSSDEEAAEMPETRRAVGE